VFILFLLFILLSSMKMMSDHSIAERALGKHDWELTPSPLSARAQKTVQCMNGRSYIIFIRAAGCCWMLLTCCLPDATALWHATATISSTYPNLPSFI